ncbi:hypothetical protein RGU72_04900 [Undibacterium sp. 5I1]|uniref:hypothetical protein n=1 Tax=unclassified Undibacterium TaxID=2630295 RepID=UPI002AB5185B|nr:MULTISPECIES: hypothetical protein [unclassified Undibacterium]MDY7537591.1 hypothetical protein [Undibacterium sp. 5I1]MEB0230135.1 hypothetical protein [Undibacterium sp. 10I3]MEB0256327.1 hypothetical protein [Undibacterium sp. 5I1]
MPSRFFTYKEGLHFPNTIKWLEVTKDLQFFHHYDDGTVELRKSKNNHTLDQQIAGVVARVASGMWVELDQDMKPISQDVPTTQFAEIW